MNWYLLLLLIFFISLATDAQNEPSGQSSSADAGVLPSAEESDHPSPDDEGILPSGGLSYQPPSADAGVLPSTGELDQSFPDDDGFLPPNVNDGSAILPTGKLLPKGGEPRVVSSVPSGYAPATGGPLSIKKPLRQLKPERGMQTACG